MVAAKLFDPGAARQRVDRYELIGEIASGGMATVFLARLTGVGGFRRFVAIKRLHPHLAGEQEFVEMFLDEARLAAGIHHPNVVSILEVSASPIGYYLVMEYVEGDTLARLLARAAGQGQRLPTPIALRILIDSLSGLHGAHELRDDRGALVELVHRDVSPQNVLVGVDGVSRITDFGVARAASRLSATRVGQLKGKLAYMAPEQATGADIDRRADVFSAGVMIWETLAAKRLFKGETEAATLSRVLNEPIPELVRVAPGANKQISQAVMRALERNPARRYSTCAQLAEALELAAAEGSGVAAPRDVAVFVKAMLGEEIDKQRDAVRAWLASSQPSQAGLPPPPTSSPSSVSAAAMSFPAEEYSRSQTGGTLAAVEPPRRSRTPLLAATLLLVPLAAGAGFWFARNKEAPRPVVVAAPAVPTQAAPQTPAAAPVPEEPAKPAAEATDSGSSTAEPVPSVSAPAQPRSGVRRAAPRKKDASAGEDLDVRNPYR
jgi:serine/threonine-protein kinase